MNMDRISGMFYGLILRDVLGLPYEFSKKNSRS